MANYVENCAKAKVRSQMHINKQLQTDNMSEKNAESSLRNYCQYDFKTPGKQRTLNNRSKRSETRKPRNWRTTVDSQNSLLV